MSDLIYNPSTQIMLPLAVLVASLLGSLHCVSMCGGLVSSLTKTKTGAALYHLGRLFGYCSLGALFGFLGSKTLGEEIPRPLSIFSSLTLAGIFIFLGVRLLLRKPMHIRFFSTLYSMVWKKLDFKSSDKIGSFTMGLLSALLPCGWLYTFILSAIATQSAVLGILVLFFFWLGTVPALTASTVLIEKIFRPIVRKLPKLSGLILIAAGLTSLSLRSYSIFTPKTEVQSCHMQDKKTPNSHKH